MLPTVESKCGKGTQIVVYLLFAQCNVFMGEVNRAISDLSNALHVAKDGGYIRTLVDEGEPIINLLNYYDMNNHNRYINMLKKQYQRESNRFQIVNIDSKYAESKVKL